MNQFFTSLTLLDGKVMDIYGLRVVYRLGIGCQAGLSYYICASHRRIERESTYVHRRSSFVPLRGIIDPFPQALFFWRKDAQNTVLAVSFRTNLGIYKKRQQKSKHTGHCKKPVHVFSGLRRKMIAAQLPATSLFHSDKKSMIKRQRLLEQPTAAETEIQTQGLVFCRLFSPHIRNRIHTA